MAVEGTRALRKINLAHTAVTPIPICPVPPFADLRKGQVLGKLESQRSFFKVKIKVLRNFRRKRGLLIDTSNDNPLFFTGQYL
jgi:hypothetical protein